MYGKLQRAEPEEREDREDLDERGRFQCLAVLQFLEAKGFLETYVALERECGITYTQGALPTAGVLEASLDMFGRYGSGADGCAASQPSAVEEALLNVERGVCCTGPLDESSACSPDGMPANVTAVCWLSRRFDEFMSLVATADRRLSLFGPGGGAALDELPDLPSPLLSLDAWGGERGFEVLATAMGGDVRILSVQELGGAWSIDVSQSFRDHTKNVSSGRFAPPVVVDDLDEERPAPSHFLTISRDHSARLYARDAGGREFSPAGVLRFPGEVTACCWLGPTVFALAAREDHHLLYFDVQGGADGGPKERCKCNLNALGDSVVSFAVLALAVSPDGKMVAACTDKSRVTVLEAFTARQLRNLYGAIIEEYDTPSVCFSLDGTFVYATSSLVVKPKGMAEEDLDERLAQARPMCGQVSIFELRTGEQVLQLACHERPVRCMAMHPHTEALVTGAFDRTVRYWG